VRIMLTLMDREEISRGLAEDLLFIEKYNTVLLPASSGSLYPCSGRKERQARTRLPCYRWPGVCLHLRLLYPPLPILRFPCSLSLDGYPAPGAASRTGLCRARGVDRLGRRPDAGTWVSQAGMNVPSHD